MLKATLKTLCFVEYRKYGGPDEKSLCTAIDVVKVLDSIVINTKTPDELTTFVEMVVAPLREKKPLFHYPYPVALGAFLALLNAKKCVVNFPEVHHSGLISSIDTAIIDTLSGQVENADSRTDVGQLLVDGHMGGVSAFGSTRLAIEYINRAVDVWMSWQYSMGLDTDRVREFINRLPYSAEKSQTEEETKQTLPVYSEFASRVFSRIGVRILRDVAIRPSELTNLVSMLK